MTFVATHYALHPQDHKVPNFASAMDGADFFLEHAGTELRHASALARELENGAREGRPAGWFRERLNVAQLHLECASAAAQFAVAYLSSALAVALELGEPLCIVSPQVAARRPRAVLFLNRAALLGAQLDQARGEVDAAVAREVRAAESTRKTTGATEEG